MKLSFVKIFQFLILLVLFLSYIGLFSSNLNKVQLQLYENYSNYHNPEMVVLRHTEMQLERTDNYGKSSSSDAILNVICMIPYVITATEFQDYPLSLRKQRQME